MADEKCDSGVVHSALLTGMYRTVSFLKTKESEKEETEEEEETQLLRTSKAKGNNHQGKADGGDRCLFETEFVSFGIG